MRRILVCVCVCDCGHANQSLNDYAEEEKQWEKKPTPIPRRDRPTCIITILLEANVRLVQFPQHHPPPKLHPSLPSLEAQRVHAHNGIHPRCLRGSIPSERPCVSRVVAVSFCSLYVEHVCVAEIGSEEERDETFCVDHESDFFLDASLWGFFNWFRK